MAAADPRTVLLEEATCSICRDLYTDPVTLDCGHNFCLACFSTFKSKEDLEKACPECKERFDQEKEMKPNKRLANMVEAVKTLQKAPGSLCEEHGERLQLFCETDEDLLCVFCMGSGAHREHSVTLVKKAEQEYKVTLQDWLGPLRKEVGYILECKLKEEEQYNTMRNKMRAEKHKIVTEIERLRQILREEEQTLYQRLEKMEETINMVENANINKLSIEIASLQALITDIEKKCKEATLDLLKDVRSTLNRCEKVKFQGPDQVTKKEKETAVEAIKTLEEGMMKNNGVAVCAEGSGGEELTFILVGRSSVPGPHAIVLVLQPGRFLKEEERAVKRIQDLFGNGAEKYMILLFTRKEDLDDGLEAFVSSSGGKLKELLAACGSRYLVLNNKATGGEKEEQRRYLISMIDRMVEENGGRGFKHPMYEEAEKAFRKKQKEIKVRLLQERRVLTHDEMRAMATEALLEEVEKGFPGGGSTRSAAAAGGPFRDRLRSAVQATLGAVSGGTVVSSADAAHAVISALV